ncbi:MAG: sulfatase [Hydrogenophilales bacterium 12-61-10]|nr:MAG: sulfatase [Hydrogenophilales bacterium 12-61-10]OYX28957.1 MAG: sulfatase [Hydrogenophilales bacterium 32-62-9]
MKPFLSRLRALPFLPYAVLFLGIASLTRLALTLFTGTEKTPLALWPGIFVHGFGFDLATLTWLLAPMLLWAALWPTRWRNTRWQGGLRLVLFCVLAALLLFGALSEWTFWEEFATRFNFIAVDYLVYTHEVIGNIVESYPVVPLLGSVVALAAGLTWLFRRPIRTAAAPSTRAPGRVVYAALAFLLPWGAGQLSDIDQMQFSGNAYANELAGNGLMTFFAAYQRNELDYDRFYATLPTAQAAHILGELGVEREPLSHVLYPEENASEAFDPAHSPFKRPPRNIVLITVESLSAKFLGSFGNPDGLSPRLDALAKEGVLFTQLYATGTRTVRGLEALSLGTPPIPGQAIVRRPHNEHLATLGEILRRQGYETFFLYGGYGYFDNMNTYFAGNDYQVVDRTDFPKASVGFANVWGVADEFLFDNSLTQLDQAYAAGKPFLAQIMTTSNHRPFTYPDGRIDIPSPGKREGGVKYTDYAIGRFIDQARSKPWFKDTLFVIVADHCASAAGKTSLPLEGYRIPLILYAPDLLKPGRDDRLASQIDIPPTLLDVMGLPGDDYFFGISLFEQDEPGRPQNRRVFISNYQELGYLKDGKLVVLGPKQRVDTFQIDAKGDATPTATVPRLRDEAIAYYQSAFKAFKEGALKLDATPPR